MRRLFQSVVRFARVVLLLVIATWVVFYFGIYLGSGILKNWGHQEFAANGLAQIPPAYEMDRLFTDCRRYITYGGYTPEPIWNSVAFFGGRYVLTMQVPVAIESSTTGHMVGEPRFYLNQVSRVEISPSGQVGARFSRNFNFGRKEWEAVYKAHGDFSVVGFETSTEPPVQDFDAFAKASR